MNNSDDMHNEMIGYRQLSKIRTQYRDPLLIALFFFFDDDS